MSWRVGVDIGGTFTDLVALADDGRLIRHKVSSTPRAPEEGLLEAMRALLTEVAATQIALVAHASTIATNALLGQVHLDLPRVAFITTAHAQMPTSPWKKGAPFPEPDEELYGVTTNGKLYVMGGWENGKGRGANYEYDPATDKWTKKQPMPRPVQHAALAAANGTTMSLHLCIEGEEVLDAGVVPLETSFATRGMDTRQPTVLPTDAQLARQPPRQGGGRGLGAQQAPGREVHARAP